jgi:hypothetical protein
MTTNASSGFDVRIAVIDSKTCARHETRAFPSGSALGSAHYCGAVALDGSEMHWVHISLQGTARIIGGSKPAGEKYALAAVYDKAIELVDNRAIASYRVKDRFDVTVTIGPRDRKPQIVKQPIAKTPAPSAQIPKAPVQKDQMDQLLARLKEDRPAAKPAGKKPEGTMQKLGAFVRALAIGSEEPKQSRIVKIDERAIRRAAISGRRFSR